MKFWKLEDRQDRLRTIKAIMENKAVGYGLEIKAERFQIIPNVPTIMVNCKFSSYKEDE